MSALELSERLHSHQGYVLEGFVVPEGEVSVKIYSGRFCSEVKPLTLLYTIFDRNACTSLFRTSSIEKWLRPSHAYLRTLHSYFEHGKRLIKFYYIKEQPQGASVRNVHNFKVACEAAVTSEGVLEVSLFAPPPPPQKKKWRLQLKVRFKYQPK